MAAGSNPVTESLEDFTGVTGLAVDRCELELCGSLNEEEEEADEPRVTLVASTGAEAAGFTKEGSAETAAATEVSGVKNVAGFWSCCRFPTEEIGRGGEEEGEGEEGGRGARS